MELFFVGIFGLIIGSFIAALTYRVPRGISYSQGRSFCPNCKRTIAWYDNLPVVSFFILQGKCRWCKKRISPRYPIIESATALLFILFAFYGAPLWYFPIGFILLAIFVIDSEHQIIPDGLTFAGLGFMIGVFVLQDYQGIFAHLFAGLAAAIFLLIIHLITHRRGMGLGDVKFAVLGGAIVGPAMTLVWLFLAFVIGGIVGVILLLVGSAKMKDKIAFGPFLVVGLLLTMLFGTIIYGFVFGV